MKKIVLFTFLLAFSHAGMAQEKYVSPEIQHYVDFLEQPHSSPVDYIMGLFEKYDVVILGERDHRDTTQYDLIADIISDPRFIENVGHVMTEVGSYNQTDRINRLVTSDYPDEAAFYASSLEIIRDLTFLPVWEKRNFYQLIRHIQHTNRSLSDEQKITMTLTDLEWSWEQAKRLTSDDYKVFSQFADNYRDLMMAEHAIISLDRIFDGDSPRKKALIIYNRPHSYQPYIRKNSRNTEWSARFIFERFAGRVANVMINWLEFTEEDPVKRLAGEGRWDAAFAVNNHKPVGFDFEGSPFGDDPFDFYAPPRDSTIAYKNIYTGFIYYKPIPEWISYWGYPGFIDDQFWPEFRNRMYLLNAQFKEMDEEEFKAYCISHTSEVHSRPIYTGEEMEKMQQAIDQYLKP